VLGVFALDFLIKRAQFLCGNNHFIEVYCWLIFMFVFKAQFCLMGGRGEGGGLLLRYAVKNL
jgi:hypothetical protein